MSDFEIIAGRLYRCERCGVTYWKDDGHRCSEDEMTKEIRMRDLTVNEHQSLMEEIADSLRFRPMYSAPKDGTVIEVRWEDGTEGVAGWRDRIGWVRGEIHMGDPDAWRPAHPEWNEETP